ncbi:MAG: OmpH family outer membrane protein [Treponema sp.]|jgi:outer membrane protein|nr:OmpH family outer membrane protein [Treponema sp.]
MKKWLASFLFFAALHTQAEAQQLTRFAVVDLEKVTTAFFRDSKAYRDYEAQKTKVQRDLEQRAKAFTTLKQSLYEAQNRGDAEEALRLRNEVLRQQEYLQEYERTVRAELEYQRTQLTQSDAFWQQVNNEIRYIAESEGYTMVLDIKMQGIIWYSASVDITQKLIENLRSKR